MLAPRQQQQQQAARTAAAAVRRAWEQLLLSGTRCPLYLIERTYPCRRNEAASSSFWRLMLAAHHSAWNGERSVARHDGSGRLDGRYTLLAAASAAVVTMPLYPTHRTPGDDKSKAACAGLSSIFMERKDFFLPARRSRPHTHATHQRTPQHRNSTKKNPPKKVNRNDNRQAHALPEIQTALRVNRIRH